MTIAYVPVDLPKIPYSEEKYWDFFNRYKRLHTSAKIWDNLIIRTTDYEKDIELPVWLKYNKEKKWHWTDNVVNELPELIKFINQIPIELTYINFLSNNQFVASHKDLDIFDFNKIGINQFIEEQKGFEPTSYRIIVSTSGRNDSFFVCSSINDTKKIKITIPDDTDTFLFNSTECYHGAFVPKKPKLLLFIAGFVKSKEHNELLERSIEKYSDYIIDIPLDKTKY